MDTGVKDKRRLIDITSAVQSIGNELCNTLLSFHAFTGCDTVSTFVRKGKGKVRPLRVLQKNPQFMTVFAGLGTRETLSEEEFKDLEAFTCRLYGAKTGVDINKLRYATYLTRFTPKNQLLSTESGIDLSLLPPCRSSLRMHIKRANYQSLIWNQTDLAYPELDKPYNGHGWTLKGDALSYQWTDGEMMPLELVDLAVEQGIEGNQKDTEDYYDTFDDEEEMEEDGEEEEQED